MKFEDVREEILEKLESLKGEGQIEENVTLVEDFVNMPLTGNLNELRIGGPSAPMIMLLGKSGRVYFFAFKVLDIK